MSKKKLLVIIISIVLIACLIGVYFVFFHQSANNNPIDYEKGKIKSGVIDADKWLKVSSLDELEKLTKQAEKEIEYGSAEAYISELSFCNGTADYNYDLDSDNNIVGLSVGYILVDVKEDSESYIMEDITSEELSIRVDAVMKWLSDNLKVNIGNNYYIISSDGKILETEDNSSYQEILDGTAYLELRILDVDDSVWVLNIEKVQGYNIISCILEHCPADSEEAQLPCDVAIEQ